VLETYPRDELFQAPAADLIRIARGVVNLYERRTVRLLARRDPYHRFYSCLVYVPRDRYNTEVRQRIEQIVLEASAAPKVESTCRSPAPITRACMSSCAPTRMRPRKPDLAAIENASRTPPHLDRPAARGSLSSKRTRPPGWRSRTATGAPFRWPTRRTSLPADALEDLQDLEALREPQAMRLNLHRPARQDPSGVHLKIVKLGDPVPISDLLPMLENFRPARHLRAPYELAWPEGGAAWIQDFELEHRDALASTSRAVWSQLQGGVRGLGAARSRTTASTACCSARTCRARDRRAARLLPLPAADRRAVQPGLHGTHARREPRDRKATWCALFQAYFEPRAAKRARQRDALREKLVAQIRAALKAVTSLDEDRILRAYLNVVRRRRCAPTSTSGKTAGKPKSYVSFKFDPHKIPDLPLPRPKFEIFVYSPRVEGRAPAHGRRRPRRHPLVRPARGFPHRDPGPDEGAERQEHRHRAGRRQGRFRREAPALPAPRGAAGRSHRLLPDLIRGMLDLTDNIVNGTASCRRRRSCGATATTLPRGRGRQGHRHVSPTSPTPSRRITASGWGTPSPRAARRATTTRRWPSPRAAPGSASSGTSARSASISRRGLHRHRRRRHVGRCVRQRHAAVAPHPPAGRLRPPHIFSIPPRMPRRALPSAAPVRCRARAGMTTTARRSRAAAACSRAPRNRSRSRRRRRRCSAWPKRRAPPNESSAPSCACRSTSVERRHRHLRQSDPGDATARSATAATMRCA
jgi:hypothetical protein